MATKFKIKKNGSNEDNDEGNITTKLLSGFMSDVKCFN